MIEHENDTGHPIVDRKAPSQSFTGRDIDNAFPDLPQLPKTMRIFAVAAGIALAVGFVFYHYISPRQMTQYEMQHSLPPQSKM
jgi:hypothetical protein